MSDFRVILLEGLFYALDGRMRVEESGGRHVSLDEVLQPVSGSNVLLVLHHLPQEEVDPSRPGAGSCRYPGGRGCPAGHEHHPDRLLTFRMEGALRGDPWRIEHTSDTTCAIPFVGMPGHYGRLAITTVVDLADLRKKLSTLGADALQGLPIEELKTMLDRLRKMKV